MAKDTQPTEVELMREVLGTFVDSVDDDENVSEESKQELHEAFEKILKEAEEYTKCFDMWCKR